MNRNLNPLAAILALVFATVLVGLSAFAQDDLTWTGSVNNVWDIDTTANWTGDDTVFNNGDNVTFDGTADGAISVDAGGVEPGSVNVTGGSYSFSGGDIGGSGGMTIGNASVAIGQAYEGLVYTGDTTINTGGLVQIDHNTQDGGPSDRSLGGTTVLNGGTLRFQHTGPGWANPQLTYTNGITVGANGGTIDFTGAANNFGTNTLSAPTLGGDLTISGVTGNPNIIYNFTSGTMVLTTDAKITNATGPDNAHTIRLTPDISGADYTLTLDKSGAGTGFRIIGATASSIDLGNLAVGDDGSLYLSSSAGVNPLSQIKANSGVLAMGSGATLAFQGTNSSNNGGSIYDPTAVTWSGNGTLIFAQDPGGNKDTYNRVSNANLVVSTASGLTSLHAHPHRAWLTIDSPHALEIGDGGTLHWGTTTLRGTFRGNLNLLDGATLVGVRHGYGGIIRDTTGGGDLTLGDGTPSTITVQGDYGVNTDTFNIGFANNVVDQGNVTMKYANTGGVFNVGWSNGATGNNAPLAALVLFPETSGGTIFAPLAGSDGVAVVGPDGGAVANFAQAATLTTSGTVGFYNNSGTNNTRGALGPIEIVNGGSFAIQETGGIVQASAITVDAGGSLAGIGTFDAPTIDVAGSVNPGNSIGTLNLTGDTTFNDGSILEIEIAGRNPGEFDVLNVDGDLTFNETTTLNVIFESFTPGAIESWDFLTVTGTLFGLENLALPSDLYFISQLDNTFTLNKIPEPSAGLLLALGSLALLKRTRKP